MGSLDKSITFLVSSHNFSLSCYGFYNGYFEKTVGGERKVKLSIDKSTSFFNKSG